jgi:hypothetical protein
MVFESYSTAYEVVALHLPEHPGLILFSFGLRGAPMTASFVQDDREPWDFGEFAERWNRPSLGEADLWIGFLLLRGALGYPVEFDDLPEETQRQARAPERRIGEWAHLVEEVDTWPKGWQAQIAAIRAAVVGSA